MDQLSKRILHLREATGLSARAFDRLVGNKEGHTSLIESGKIHELEGRTARKICAKFPCCTTDWVLYGDGETPTIAEARAAYASLLAEEEVSRPRARAV